MTASIQSKLAFAIMLNLISFHALASPPRPPHHPNHGNGHHHGGNHPHPGGGHHAAHPGQPAFPPGHHYNGNGPAHRPVPRPKPRPNDFADRDAAFLVGQASDRLNCDQLGDLVTRLSNRVLESRDWGHETGYGPNLTPGERERWRRNHRSPAFWRKLWNHVTVAFQRCEADCFQDGLAVGQISAAMYCSISEELGGLDDPEFLPQPPLPSCEAGIRAGCVQGYVESVRQSESCRPYATADFREIFLDNVSQDCHIEEEAGDAQAGFTEDESDWLDEVI